MPATRSSPGVRRSGPLRVSALAAVLAGAAQAQPGYLDDRSSAEAVVRSLYNAIDRGEYLRAWSYFAEGAAPDLGSFRAGYADTASVDLRVGRVTVEGAAGSTYWTVPVAIVATSTAGESRVFAGCYILSQPQPVLQEEPPFRPIAIREGHLRPTSATVDESVPESC